jgi:hypothetical protein
MPDILIPDVPEDVVSAIDARAKRVGLSRNEYLRRALEREQVSNADPVTADALCLLAELAQDLADPAVMTSAWA